jgi:hypothetical protein
MILINCNTADEFHKFIHEHEIAIVLLSKRPCGFCEKIEPIFTQISTNSSHPCMKMVIWPSSPNEMKMVPFQYGIRMAPALAVFRRGQMLNYTIEFIDEKQMTNFITNTLA